MALEKHSRYEGDPLVWIGEGKVASAATPRRGSILCQRKKNGWAYFAALMATALFSTVAQARSLLYYYDFDTVTDDGGLDYSNKGTGKVVPVFKQSGASPLGYTDGALGSDHALSYTTTSSIWLGSDSEPLECGTTNGFTIAFWCKQPASRANFSPFFAFRIGGITYRFAYWKPGEFTIYGKNGSAVAFTETFSTDDGDFHYKGVTADTWYHFAIVAAPNGTTPLGTCGLYINGEKSAMSVFRRKRRVPCSGST